MYKLHSLQYPDWYRTGTSYCYFYIFEIIHHDIVIFSKTYPSFLTIKEGIFRKPTRPSLPLRKAPPLTPTLSPQERGRKPPSGAQNRYAIRLAGHQSPRHIMRDGTAKGIQVFT